MRITLLIFTFMLLSACNPLAPVKHPAITYYTLNQFPKQVWLTDKHDKILLITKPHVDNILDSTYMLYSTKAFEVKHFVLNEWANTPAQMLQQLMSDSLRHTQSFHAVVKSPFIGKSDLRLDSNLQLLQQEFYSQRSQIHVRLSATLVDSQSHCILASKQFDITNPAASNTPYDGVLASNQAVSRLLSQLNRFILMTIASNARLDSTTPPPAPITLLSPFE